MYKSDFLLKQLEDLAVLIARMIGLRKELQLEKAEILLQEAYFSLNLEENNILTVDLTQETKKEEDAKTKFSRLQLTAELLMESYFHYKDFAFLQKAKELLFFIQENSPTFSFEVEEKLKEIESLLNAKTDL